jgi:hypothetical protein
MLRKLLLSVAAVALASPAMAAGVLQVTFPTTTLIPVQNDFITQLAGLGFDRYASTGANLTLLQASRIKFEFFGSESGYNDTFKTTGVGALTKTENTPFTAWGPVLIGTQLFSAGSLAGKLNFSAFNPSGPQSLVQSATVGQIGFGIFLKPRTLSGSTSNVYWLGYDDNTVVNADNHDDMIIKLTVLPVPEPATWAMMIGGMGIAGAAMRRRRRNGVAAIV